MPTTFANVECVELTTSLPALEESLLPNLKPHNSRLIPIIILPINFTMYNKKK